jgi:amino acid adenylation domain-containing protein
MRALHEYFEAHAASSPHRVAITSSGGALSYGELNRRANQLAHALRTRGVDADVLVGLCLATGPDLIVGMLAILKAGGGYLPLDPQQPAERLAQILSGAKPALVLTNGAAADLATDGLPTLCMTEHSEFIDAQSDTNPGMPIAAEQLCYVMFTSGSTGAPKGVMVTHGNLEFLFAGVDGAEHYGLGMGPSDVWTLFHTFSFGFSVWEIWGALRHGARLVIVAPELRADPDGLFDLLRAESVTIISQTPSAFRQNFLPDHFRHQLAPLSLRAIVLSGEAVAAEDLQCWFLQHGDDGPRLINTYAITETAGQVTVREYTAEESRGALAKSIGHPLSHTRVFILDAEQKPVSAGIVGELYVGGPGVARGYINDSRHTAERFVDLDIDGSGPQRLYRTGDQASWSANAGLQFLGRTDEQVKLRGYRIELGEVETALRGHPLVRDAAVAIQEDDHGQAKLAGYLVSAVSSVPAIAKDSESPEFWPSVGPYQLYDEFLYDLMSSEAERIERYRHAFEHSVRDKIVLDIGTGEHALLARMCLEAGARRVYAVEVLNDAYTKARELIERQGLDECIKVIHGDVASVELPDKVDVCTQGIIGNVGSADGIVSIWNSARRFFKSGCIPIPARCQTMIAAVELPDVLRDKPTFNSLAKSYAEKAFVKLGRRFDIRLCVRNFPATGIISDTHLFEDLDFSGPLNAALNGKAVFTIERDARLDGFLVWTVVTTSGTASVDYLQNQQAWLPVFLPCPDDGVSIRCGDRIAAEWSSRHSSGVNPDYRISAWVESDDQSSRGFQYESCYAETAYNSTAVHRSLWRNSSASESGASHASIKAWLAERLPDYMVPSVWVSLPELPLNANGKLDRSALPLPTRSRPELDMPFEAPRGKLQIDLAGLWSEILAIDQIGVHDNFFDLGGDSIAAVRLTSAMQRLLDDAVMLVAIFDAPTIDGLARYLSEHHEHAVTTRYDGILAESEAGRTQTDPGQASAPLSYPQQSFWLLQQLYPDQTGANEQFVITLDGTLDVDSLGLAWNAVIQRHEILRTTFHEEDGDAIQFVKAHSPTPLSIIDCRGLLSRSAESRFFAAAQEAIEKPFDLANGPLINACLFRFSEWENRLLVNAHHIIADGLSLHVIKRELASLYALAVRDRPVELATPEMQYRDFAVSQRIRLKGDRLQTCLEYWRRVLSDAPETLALPKKWLTRRSAHQQRLGFEIDPVIADGMRQLSRRENATVFMGLLAAFRTLLFRYSDQVDIPIGSPMTCRDSDAMNAMVGCLVNNVVFRTSTDGDPAFVDLLRRERDTALAAFQHSDAPFEKVVEAVRPRRQVGRHPLFQTLFLFENNRSPLAHGGAVAFGVETLETERCSYWDLEFSVTDDGDGRSIRGFLGYRTDVFERSFAEALPVHFKQLLRAIVAHPDAPISRLDLLPAVERRRLLSDWNRTRQEYPAQDTLHALFEARVRSHPSAIALIDDAGQLTYAELNRRANHLARSLRDGGGALVGIGVRRSAEMVTAVLATLKIGAAYLPLDPDYPQARLDYMLRDAGVRAICIDRKFPELTGLGTIDQIRVDSLDWQSIDNDSGATANIDVVVAPDAPAYVLYTSGSTGQPKGAVGLHRGAVNRCHWMWRGYGFGPTDVFSLRTSLNFVDSVWEIFGALLHGAPVAIIALLQALLEAEPCLGQRLPLIHTWLSSGEPLTAELLEAFRAAVPDARLLNTYGTSEIWDAACFDVSGWEISQPVVPIGKPIANVQTYILDKNMQPVPPGVTGELYVGGVGLGPGYWRRPELTIERFVPNPFAANRGTRLYRTGDLAKYLPHGDIQCLGRIDQQIKLRGFRVEPGEIETALSSHADVRRTVVDLRETRSGEPALIAYCVSAESCFDRDALYRHLQQQLPEHMIPARFVRMDELPLTPSGKIDRLSLPAPDWSEAAGKSFIPPGTLTEQTIAGLWKEVLGTARAGLQDDFFEQGGHSLSATRLLARIRAAFGVDLSLRELFDEPTVFAVATRVDFLLADRNAAAPATAKAGKEIQRVPRTEGELPLSFGQERLWFLDQLEPSSPAYNIAFTLELSGDLKVDALQSALDHLVTRHEALRTCFPSSGGRAVQKVLSALSIPLQREDLNAHGDDDLQESLAALARRPFNLVTGPLLRTHLIRLTAVDHILLIVIHHIVSDGVSNAILFEELAELYAAIAAGSAPPLPALPFQYVDYAGWQRQNQARWQAQLDYWTEQLRNAPAAVEIPTDRPRPPEQRFRGSWLWRELSADTANALRALGREHRCTLFMVMLGVFDVLLERYSGQQDIVVGTPIAGRARAEFEGLIGLFINTVALRADLAANPTFSEFLAQLRQVTLDAQANQALPFERLVEALQPDRTLSHAPVFQVMFNLTPIPQRNRDSVGLAMTMGRLLDHGVSTFDLTLSVGERTDGLDLVFEYDRDLFDRETIDRMAAHYTQLLSAVLVKTDCRIRELPILAESEVQQLSETWSSGRTHPPDDEVFAAGAQAALHLFEARADLSPDAVAVISGARHMCYGELEARANRLAHHLQTLGVGPETRVALCLDRSELILLAILGTHKAGGAPAAARGTADSARS